MIISLERRDVQTRAPSLLFLGLVFFAGSKRFIEHFPNALPDATKSGLLCTSLINVVSVYLADWTHPEEVDASKRRNLTLVCFFTFTLGAPTVAKALTGRACLTLTVAYRFTITQAGIFMLTDASIASVYPTPPPKDTTEEIQDPKDPIPPTKHSPTITSRANPYFGRTNRGRKGSLGSVPTTLSTAPPFQPSTFQSPRSEPKSPPKPEVKSPIKGIPNYASNCFVISVYLMVKHNPPLYQAIFENEEFKKDPAFAALREFDEKYDSSKALTKYDMHKVRTDTLSKFGIAISGHQDPNEVFTLSLFKHITRDCPLYSRVVSHRTITFTVTKEGLDMVLQGMDNCEIVSKKPITQDTFSAEALHTVRSDPQISLNLSLNGVKDGASIQDVIDRDLSDIVSDTFHLDSGIPTLEVRRNFEVFAADSVLITLKRFNGANIKIPTKVQFPGGKVKLDSKGDHEIKGFVVHSGRSTSSGHCVEYQKVGSQWVYTSDGYSRPVSESVAFGAMQEAYIVYAERA